MEIYIMTGDEAALLFMIITGSMAAIYFAIAIYFNRKFDTEEKNKSE